MFRLMIVYHLTGESAATVTSQVVEFADITEAEEQAQRIESDKTGYNRWTVLRLYDKAYVAAGYRGGFEYRKY